jgi:acetyl esterase/lipase
VDAGPVAAVMWVHGGGFLGGSKEELSSYFKLLASHGYTVVAPLLATPLLQSITIRLLPDS